MSVWRNDISTLANKLIDCVRRDNIFGARYLLFNITEKEDMKSIVAKRVDCIEPLFEAVMREKVKMVIFFVKECYVDLEERSKYDNKLVTPLWYAAATEKLESVRCLIDLGADINAASDDGCTPVLVACGLSNPVVAECLIRYGADIKKPNTFGQTCLMKAVHTKALCQLLIDNGADVKAQDKDGCLALHHAIFMNQPDTVQLLINHGGSDPYVKNKAGDDAFRSASLKGEELILNDLLFEFKPQLRCWIESYQLLGGYCVDFRYDIDKAMNSWKDAVDVQQGTSCVEIIPSKPNPVYLFAQEVNTVEELEALARNQDSVHMYALMIRERILGPYHNHTIEGLLNRGESYRCNGEIRRCIDIWKYALQLQNSGEGLLTYQYQGIIDSLGYLFYEFYEAGRQSNSSVDQLILIKDSLDVLEMATAMFELAVGNKHAEEISEEESDLMIAILLIIRVITELDMNVHQVLSFRNIVHRLVRCQPRTDHGRTLLHVLIFPHMHSSPYIESILPFSNIAVVELLLECGAEVNAVDDEHNTALHLCSKAIQDLKKEQHHDLMKRIAELLLKNGAHADMVNIEGDRAVDSLTFSLLEINMFDFVNLRCLAARVVVKYKIPYIEYIPASLESFIQMHGTLMADSDAVPS